MALRQKQPNTRLVYLVKHCSQDRNVPSTEGRLAQLCMHALLSVQYATHGHTLTSDAATLQQ